MTFGIVNLFVTVDHIVLFKKLLNRGIVFQFLHFFYVSTSKCRITKTIPQKFLCLLLLISPIRFIMHSSFLKHIFISSF